MQAPHEALRKVTAKINNEEHQHTLAIPINATKAETATAVVNWAILVVDTMFAEGEIDYPGAAFCIETAQETSVGFRLSIRFVRDDDQIGLSYFQESLEKLFTMRIDHNDDDEDAFGTLAYPEHEIIKEVVGLYKQMVLANRIPINVK